jgi:hypothetical protein
MVRAEFPGSENGMESEGKEGVFEHYLARRIAFQNPPPDFIKHRKDGSLLLICFHFVAWKKYQFSP